MTINVAMAACPSALILCAAAVLTVAMVSGFMCTRSDRRAAMAVTIVAVAAAFASRQAFKGGVRSLQQDDNSDPFHSELQVLPPMALSVSEYPLLGAGTRMQQNARLPLGIHTRWTSEGERGRYLIELGAPGYLFIWLARLGLLLSLLRPRRTLDRLGHKGAAALAALTMLGRLTFDRVWQALFFLSVGLVLALTTEALEAQRQGEVT
jgi:hypothetical protein